MEFSAGHFMVFFHTFLLCSPEKYQPLKPSVKARVIPVISTNKPPFIELVESHIEITSFFTNFLWPFHCINR